MGRLPWLLFLHSLPAKRGASRVSLWRQLKKCGAVTLKTSTAVLPDRLEQRERFQWLAQHVRDAGGDATLVHAAEIEGIGDEELVALFNDARAADYSEVGASLRDALGGKRRPKETPAVTAALENATTRFEEIRRIDFFDCPRGQEVQALIEHARRNQSGGTRRRAPLSRKAFAGKIWLTRPRPEIDRVACAWLIRRFIDPKARFVFAPTPVRFPEALPFDVPGAEFSHHGDDCTFETLVRRFALDDAVLRKMGEMVHAADLEDGKFAQVECFGIDRVLKGWARLGLSDQQLIEKGAECFDALYEYLRKRP